MFDLTARGEWARYYISYTEYVEPTATDSWRTVHLNSKCPASPSLSKKVSSKITTTIVVVVVVVVVVLRGRAVSLTGDERSRRGDVTSSRARTSPRALFNPHVPGRTFAHHPALSNFPIEKVPFDADYLTEFTGLRVKYKYQWDCTHGANSEGFGYYDVVPSRRFKCREHADASREGTKTYTP